MTEPAAPDAKLERSLDALAALGGAAAIRSRDLSRTHRERLLSHGLLREVIKGWYVAVRPGEDGDDARCWYDVFWGFCAGYLDARFAAGWSLAPEQSLALHSGDWTIPRQLVARAGRGGNKPLALPHQTSLLDLRLQPPPPERLEVRALNVRVMELETALVATPAASYREHPRLLHAALWLLTDLTTLADRLIEGSHSKVAGRLIGALRRIGRPGDAEELAGALQAAGFTVRASDPFPPAWAGGSTPRNPSPHPNRESLRRRWAGMRAAVLSAWPQAVTPRAVPAEGVDPAFAAGYRKLCAAPARGDGQPVSRRFRREHPDWHRRLLAPAVAAGEVDPACAGRYRLQSRFRRGAIHTPPRHEAMRDLLPILFELLEAETDLRVAAVLGHWLLTLLTPFERGNRLLAQALSYRLLESAGIDQGEPLPKAGPAYQTALESAWVDDDPRPLTRLLAGASG